MANEIGEFFIRKITAIRSQLGANGKSVSRDVTCEPATVELRSDGIELSQFQPLSEETVRQMALANSKSCSLDPLPSAVLSTCIDKLLPVITKMVNLSLETGCFAEVWKNALVHSLLKKQGLQLVNKNFRPVNNLQFTSKLTEKAVAVQLQDHMLNNNLFLELQSAYCQHHSTETALLNNDILMSMDKGHVTLLVLLDLSSAFDIVDHRILLNRLQSSLGVRGKAFSWFQSYLEGRSQQIPINGTLSKKFDLNCGVPQGSCLGPLQFTIYVSKLFDIIKLHLPSAHMYADDTQLYLSFKLSDSTTEAEAKTIIRNDDVIVLITSSNLHYNMRM